MPYRRMSSLWSGGVALVAAFVLTIRSDPRAQQFRSDANVVRVEVAARDAAGRPVTGLTQQQFRLLEDGKQQDISLFVEVRGDEPPAHPSTASAVSEGAQSQNESVVQGPQLSLIAVVVDRMSPEARAFLARALDQFMDSTEGREYFGIFSSDGGLRTLQGFTRDKGQLKAAIRQIAITPSTQFGREHERNNPGTPDAHPSVPVVASAESAGRPITTPGESQEAAALATLGSSNSWEALARNQQGYASTDALLAMSAILGRVQGRRTIVFFADHLAIPDAVLPHFNNVVATANQAQVAFYTVDTAGLRVHSGDAETGREVRAMGEAGLKMNPDGSNSSTLALMERNEDVLRKDPRTSLTLLADRTGGEFTGNTNDLSRGLKRVLESQRFYYVLGYVPKSANSERPWRRIEVKVEGRKLALRHRQGYVAVTQRRHE